MSFIDDFRNLDRNNIGGWPKSVKLIFTVLVFVLILFFGWCFKISDQQGQLGSLRQKEDQLRQEFVAETGQGGQSRRAQAAARRDAGHAATDAAAAAEQDRDA